MKNINLFILLSFSISTGLVNAQTPVANFTATDSVVCEYSCINFTDFSTNATSWKWVFPGATPSSSSQQNPQNICYLSTGTYDVRLIAINGINNDTLILQNYITVNPTPAAPVITQSFNMLYCSTDTSYVSYQWYSDNMLIPGATHSAFLLTHAGNYNVQVSNTFGCFVAVGINIWGDYHRNALIGNCFIDYNTNAVQDSGEPGYYNTTIASTGLTKTWITHPDQQGYFYNSIDDTGNVVTNLQNISAYTVTPVQHTSNFTSNNHLDSVNFALVPIPGIRDLRIYIVASTPHRPGRDVTYIITYSNAGTDTVASGTVYLKKDPRLVMVSSIPAYTGMAGDSISWTYADLKPNETRTIYVTLHVPIPPTVNIGDKLSSKAVIEPLTPNENLTYNYAYLNDVVVGSFDPNDKRSLFGDVITTQQIADGQYLSYLIRFQNTGNDTAFLIVLKDTIDSHLDMSTLEVLSASGSYAVSVQNQNKVTFTFENILLPDSNVDEPASHGYISYRIKPNSSATSGVIIKNRAYIYFDYNAAVPTNTAMTAVTFPEAVDAMRIDNGDFWIYPNPAGEELSIHLPASSSDETFVVKIKNLVGQEAASPQARLIRRGEFATINVSKLPCGIYFIEVTGGTDKWVGRFVKE